MHYSVSLLTGILAKSRRTYNSNTNECVCSAINIDIFFRIIFTEEAGFSREGIVHLYINHIWVEENLPDILEARFQNKCTVFFTQSLAGCT